MEQFVGIILCGGKSTRMGQDKGLLPTADSTWAGHLQAMLRKVGVRQVYFSVGQHNVQVYADKFGQAHLLLDQAMEDVPSPLVGVLSAYHLLKTAMESKQLLVLACDLQQLDPSILKILIDQATSEPKQIHVLSDGEFMQPLAGIYPMSKLAELECLLEETQGQKRSVIRLVKRAGARVHELPEADRHHLKNFNSPADLNKNHFQG